MSVYPRARIARNGYAFQSNIATAFIVGSYITFTDIPI